MSWYTLDGAENFPHLYPEWPKQITAGTKNVSRSVLKQCAGFSSKNGRPCVLAFDGYQGADFKIFISVLKKQAKKLGLKTRFIDISGCYLATEKVVKKVRHCLGNDDYFGYVYKGTVDDFFETSKLKCLCKQLKVLTKDKAFDVVVCYGVGAAVSLLKDIYDFTGYLDITRETYVRKFESGRVGPFITGTKDLTGRRLVKRICYVDHIILHRHKKNVLRQTDFYIDANSVGEFKLLPRQVYEGVLAEISKMPFRLKPVYMPGVWGGQYLKKVCGLPKSMINCAFCLVVVPQEQAIRIDLGQTEIEIPSYNLFWAEPVNVMGKKSFRKFGHYFPLSVNYDDTYKGGNLAIQVHPNGKYLKDNFNERIRRDESYYIVKAFEGAKTYHGLKDDADIEDLKNLSIEAETKNRAFDHDKLVNSSPSRPGDLILIPAGTVHASGANQLVLEIDTDPAWGPTEYTFHIYDYLRRNLDGSLRAIHIDHSFNVIRKNRRTSWIPGRLKHEPRIVRRGRNWAEFSLGTHKDMYYRTHRLEFTRSIKCDTKSKFNILVLVEGQSIEISTAAKPSKKYEIKFTEGIIIPACVGGYKITNAGKCPCKVTRSFIK